MASRKRKNWGTSKRSAKTVNANGWIWLVLGLVLGLIIAGLIYFKQNKDVSHRTVKTTSAHKQVKSADKKPSKAESETTQPQFDFYSMLSKAKSEPVVNSATVKSKPTPVVPVTNPTKPLAPVTAPAPTTANAENSKTHTANPVAVGKYVLQIASLKNYADADRLKAELTMLGYDVFIQKMNTGEGVWNRVNVGPYSSHALALQQQEALRKNKVNSILLKMP